jgi:lysophospholipase L1-like esterase
VTDRRLLFFGDSLVAGVGDPTFVSVIEGPLASPVWMEQVAEGDGAHPCGVGYEALADLVLAGGWLDWLRTGAP